MDNDIDYLEAFKKGNHQAFEKLVSKYKDIVFNRAYSIVGNIHEADELSQEVFLQVYYSAGSFKYKSSFSTWLYRVTVNKCLNELRKKKKRTVSLEDELNEEEELKIKDVLRSSEESIENKMLREEQRKIIRKILSSLPEKYRLILTLNNIENLSYKEISEELGISIDRVKIWLYRARQKLKERLEPLYKEAT